MSVISPLSGSESAPEALDIFRVYSNQAAVQNYYQENIRPVSQFSGIDAPLEFETSLQGDAYCELLSTRLFLRAQILNADGTACGDDVKISPCDLFFHSMFKKVDVYMNRTLVSSSGDLFPYKSYFSSSAVACRLAMGHSQSVNSFLEVILAFRLNEILTRRYKVCHGSKPFDMVGLPLNDLMELDRYLINGVHLRIVLHRNSEDFCLISGEDNDNGRYQVKLLDCYLRVMKCKPNPAILVAHNKVHKGLTAKYPYIRTVTKSANIASGQSVFSWDHINASCLPKFVIVSFVDSAAVLGSLKLNPFNMEHFDVRQISLYVNGIPCSGCPINVNYNQDLTVEVFDRMYGFGKGRPLYTAMVVSAAKIAGTSEQV